MYAEPRERGRQAPCTQSLPSLSCLSLVSSRNDESVSDGSRTSHTETQGRHLLLWVMFLSFRRTVDKVRMLRTFASYCGSTASRERRSFHGGHESLSRGGVVK